jgi:carboxylesterase type B
MHQLKPTAGELLPVMVFIFGGSFTSGDNKAGNYGPHYLLDKDIVLVTINYRLSVLGECHRKELITLEINVKCGCDTSATTHHL